MLKPERKPGLVLMYHRVHRPAYDPWELSVSPEHFEQQLQALHKTGLVRNQEDFVESTIQKGMPGILISFDDGYADNYETALPLLEKFGLPATFFICTSQIGSDRAFWWDELADLILGAEGLPDQLEIPLQQEFLHLQNPGAKGSPERDAFYRKAWSALSPLSSEHQFDVLNTLRERLDLQNHTNPNNRLLSADALKELSQHPLVTIGGHTHTHPDLSRLNREEQFLEIKENRDCLQEAIEKPVLHFAYPSGRFDAISIDVLKELGFRSAYTTRASGVQKNQDLLQVGRYQVKDVPGSVFSRLLKGWS